MFEVPKDAECGLSSWTDLPACHRPVSKMVTVLTQQLGLAQFESVGVCTKHAARVAAAGSKKSELPPAVVPLAEFPGFMQEVMSWVA